MQLKQAVFPVSAVLIWSGNTIISKLSAGLIEPAAMSLYRWLLAALLLTPFCLGGVWRQRRQIRPHLWKVVVLALFGMVLYQSLAYFAAATSSAMNMGMIASLMPLLTILSTLVKSRRGSNAAPCDSATQCTGHGPPFSAYDE